MQLFGHPLAVTPELLQEFLEVMSLVRHGGKFSCDSVLTGFPTIARPTVQSIPVAVPYRLSGDATATVPDDGFSAQRCAGEDNCD
ncbi:MAG: hypothetical protein D6725_15325 [Planctomycetota bacterium]|nr:MAG: hypothetical protein D6725_15325 [Planctomycetota bacterium]